MTTKAAAHSPLPWKANLSTVYWNIDDDISSEDIIICSTIILPDAAFIALAVNNHQELVKALDRLHDQAHKDCVSNICFAKEALRHAEEAKP